MNGLKDKVVLVTGATSGIGKATAIAFGKAGARVVLTGRREKEGLEAQKAVEATGAKAFFHKLDVTSEKEIDIVVTETVSRFGRLDFAFNNAGVEGVFSSTEDATSKQYDEIFNTNVRGVFLAMKYEIAAMKKSGGGSIVNCGSISGLIGMPNLGLYVASKHAVFGLTKSAALELAKSGIRVNVVSPAGVDTDLTKRLLGNNKEARDNFVNYHPMGRFGTEDEIAYTVLFLCSEHAGFITGQSITVDGGVTAA